MLPDKIPFEVTIRCNCRCEMCRYYSDNSPEPDLSEMSTAQVKASLIKFKKFYAKNNKKLKIGLTGGEPLIRSDIKEIIAFMKKEGIQYDIVTNLSLASKDIIDFLKTNPPFAIDVSIDGVGETHNKIRRAKIFDKVKENLLYIKKSLPKIPLQIDCTITNTNHNKLAEMAQFAVDNKINLNIRHLNFVTKELLKKQQNFELTKFGKVFNHSFNLYSIEKKNVSALVKEIKKVKRIASKQDIVKITFFPNLKSTLNDWYLTPEKQLSTNFCDPYKIRIKPNGDIVHCENYAYGNIIEQSLDAIIRSKKTQRFVNVLKKSPMPFCNRCCFSFMNYLEK